LLAVAFELTGDAFFSTLGVVVNFLVGFSAAFLAAAAIKAGLGGANVDDTGDFATLVLSVVGLAEVNFSVGVFAFCTGVLSYFLMAFVLEERLYLVGNKIESACFYSLYLSSFLFLKASSVSVKNSFAS
jgi:hypothetical protein